MTMICLTIFPVLSNRRPQTVPIQLNDSPWMMQKFLFCQVKILANNILLLIMKNSWFRIRPKGNWYSNEDQDDIALTQEHLVAKEILEQVPESTKMEFTNVETEEVDDIPDITDVEGNLSLNSAGGGGNTGSKYHYNHQYQC